MERSREFLEQALAHFQKDDNPLRARAYVFLGMVFLESDIQKAEEAFTQAYDCLDKENNSGILTVLYYLCWTQILGGKLTQAAASAELAYRYTQKMLQWPIASVAHLAKAELFCERNQLDLAEQHAVQAFELAQKGGYADNQLIANLDFSRIQRATGNWPKVQEAIDRAAELAGPTIPWIKSQLVDEQVYLFLALGKVDEAWRCFRESQELLGIQTPIPRLAEQIREVRIRVARQEAHQALAQIEDLLEAAKKKGLLRWVIQIHCLWALALHSLGRTSEALEKFKQAILFAEPEGSVNVFLDEGTGLIELLLLVRKGQVAPEFVARVLNAFHQRGSTGAAQPPLAQHILSKREIELLRLISNGCSNKEIATQLIISIGTVKRHTVNIFTKLAVKNRTEAVAKARELGLI